MTEEEIQEIAADFSSITFMIDNAGHLHASTLMPGKDHKAELKNITKLFVALHTGQLININAKNLLAYCQELGLTAEGMQTIDHISKKINKINSQPLIKPSEVLVPREITMRK